MAHLHLVADVCTPPPRAFRHMPDPERSPNLYALKAEARPGRCIVCDGPLPESRGKKPRTDLCGLRDCKLVYDAACAADQWHREKSRAAHVLRKVAAR